MSVCRSCEAPIVWAVTYSGKRMPVDRDPVEHGNLVLFEVGPDEWRVELAVDHPTIADRHVSHFATCPDAATHRRSRQ